MVVVIAEESRHLAALWRAAFRSHRECASIVCSSPQFLDVVSPDAMVAYVVDMAGRYGDGRLSEEARVLGVHQHDPTLPRLVVTLPARLWDRVLQDDPRCRPERASEAAAQAYAYAAMLDVFRALLRHNSLTRPEIAVFGIDGPRLRGHMRYRGAPEYLIAPTGRAYEDAVSETLRCR